MLKNFAVGTLAFALLGDFATAVDLNGWIKKHKADGDIKVKLTLPVKQSNLDVVEKLFWEVSNPSSALYGKYLSFEEVGDLVKNPAATEATIAYLRSLGVSDEEIESDPHGTFITAHVPIRTANAAFNADFHVYSHPQAADEIVKSESADLPKELEQFVTNVPHVSFFPHMNRRFRSTPEFVPNAIPSAPGYVSPSLLFSYYGIDNIQVTHGATQSIFAELSQSFDNQDLNMFQAKFGVTQRNITNVIGANNPNACFQGTGSCSEANLDVQYIMAVAQGAETAFWSMSGYNDPLLDWVTALSAAAKVPMVHSISYGGYEYGGTDMTNFNVGMQKLGLRGVSVMVSSGDDGVANFKAKSDGTQCGYHPAWPASCPYITSVGATQGPESGTAEVACSARNGAAITTGGGFSAVYAQPSYQTTQVANYFKVAPAASAGYTNGRGYPDVSVLGHLFAVEIGGQLGYFDGTSASSPTFAGMITLINDARLAKGKSALGFLNQALYSLNSNVWNDITSGDNKCTSNKAICCYAGFTAAAGWDPVTGLGTPRYQNLKAALVAL